MNLPPHVQAQDKIILFDGVCKLCNRWSQFIITHDTQRRFKLCSVQSQEGGQILAWFGLPKDKFDTMLLVEGPVAYQQSDAFLRVVAQLPRPWCYLRALGAFPKRFRNWFYDRIALNRYRLFGRYDTCVMPSDEVRGRFVGGNVEGK